MQVMVLHSYEFTLHELTVQPFFMFLRLFPGVPIFFFISGYLISRAFEKSPAASGYFRNRALRIFPALYVCILLNLIFVWSTGYFSDVDAGFFDIAALFMAKATILQFYNPEFMRMFGDGVLNGSLWTICVELQFYFVIPIVYFIFKLNTNRRNVLLIVLMIIFLLANRYLYYSAENYSNTLVWKLYRVSFAPWLYMFLFGVIVQRNFVTFAKYINAVPVIVFLFGYMIAAYLSTKILNLSLGNGISPILFFPLALLIFRMSYSMVDFSNKLLRGNDISYGIYIWHMVFVNQLIYMRETILWTDVLIVILVTISFSFISWNLIEKKCLQFKTFTLQKTVR